MDPDLLPAREPGSRRIHVLIDTPAGSRNKYKYDRALGVFRVSRVLPAGMAFPYDFGSIPQTRAPDGDPPTGRADRQRRDSEGPVRRPARGGSR